EPMARVDELRLRGVAAEAEADRRPCLAIVEAERAQHMARAPRSACAGASKREGDVTKIGKKPCRINAFAADIQIPVIAVTATSVDDPAGSKRVQRGLPQPLNMVVVAVAALVGEFRGDAEADAQLGRQRARAKSLLLAAAVDQRGR